MDCPLLLIHFNRPDITKRAIEALKPVAPKRIWVLCDGARPNMPGEIEKVAEVRNLLECIPWECDVQRLYQNHNLGCFRNISEGISWFFDNCEEGIILEDDCLADPSFFGFCTQLLERYREDPTVYAIAGHNRSNTRLDPESDYLFSNYFECWGWATWKRAWDNYDPEMTGWRDRALWKEICDRVFTSYRRRIFWNLMFGKVAKGQRDSWAYRYFLSILKNRGKTIIPSINLTENIGFRKDGTHAKSTNQNLAKSSTVEFPLRHPTSVDTSRRMDDWLEDNFHSKSLINRIDWAFRKLFK